MPLSTAALMATTSLLHGAFVTPTAADQQITRIGEPDFEIRLGFKRSGYEKLRVALGLTNARDRDDTTFDAWNGSAFVFGAAHPDWKMRLMRKEKEGQTEDVFQFSRLEAQEAFAVNGRPYGVTLRTKWEDALSHGEGRAFAMATTRFFENVLPSNASGGAVRAAADALFSQWSGLSTYARAMWQSEGDVSHSPVFPSDRARKHRLVGEITLAGGERVKLKLGTSVRTFPAAGTEPCYELEAQIDGSPEAPGWQGLVAGLDRELASGLLESSDLGECAASATPDAVARRLQD